MLKLIKILIVAALVGCGTDQSNDQPATNKPTTPIVESTPNKTTPTEASKSNSERIEEQTNSVTPPTTQNAPESPELNTRETEAQNIEAAMECIRNKANQTNWKITECIDPTLANNQFVKAQSQITQGTDGEYYVEFTTDGNTRLNILTKYPKAEVSICLNLSDASEANQCLLQSTKNLTVVEVAQSPIGGGNPFQQHQNLFPHGIKSYSYPEYYHETFFRSGINNTQLVYWYSPDYQDYL